MRAGTLAYCQLFHGGFTVHPLVCDLGHNHDVILSLWQSNQPGHVWLSDEINSLYNIAGFRIYVQDEREKNVHFIQHTAIEKEREGR